MVVFVQSNHGKFMYLRSWLVFLGLVSFSALASDKLEQQRADFNEALTYADNPHSQRAQQLLQRLEGYPLLPYVQQAILLENPYLANQQKIETFLAAYENSPLARPLRVKWLTYLKQQKQDVLFLRAYQDSGDTSLYCHYLTLRFGTEPDEQIFPLVDQLWMTGQSLPKACDPVLARWKNAHQLNTTKVYRRLVLAANGGNHTLIPYLKSLLPEEQQYLADSWYAVRRSPGKITNSKLFPGHLPEQETEIITYGLKRLAWRDRDEAIRAWALLKDKFPFSDAQREAIAERFAVALTLINHDKAEEWLEVANQDPNDSDIIHWHLAHLLRQQQWPRIVAMLEAADNQQSELSHQYWLARSYEALESPQQATQRYQHLAGKRHYYGFLASGRILTEPALADVPLEINARELNQIATMPAAQRAYELLQIGRDIDARREWVYLLRELNEQQRIMAAVLADSWQWHDQAIHTFSKAGYLDDVKRRFPLAYKDTLLASAQANDIEPAWAFAIARRESSFMRDAYSGVGARGLMQLMPGTARYLAKKRIALKTLYEPEINAQYGSQYLKYLMDKMENNQVLATASYNAGWRRVKQWLPEADTMPADIWIETIPYKETRNYVKAVMAYKQIYLRLLGKNEHLFSELATMEIAPADD